MELDNLEAVKRMVASGLGASIVPAAAITEQEADGALVARPSRAGAHPARWPCAAPPADAALSHVREALLTLAE